MSCCSGVNNLRSACAGSSLYLPR